MAATVTAKTGPLAGHQVVGVDMERLTDFKQRMIAAGVRYSFGAKDPHPGSGRVGFSAIDCSGFVRTLLLYATLGTLADLPDGSAMQQEYMASLGLKESAAADTGANDNVLRIAFHLRDDLDGTGHVWLATHAHTIESCGGVGPTERPWDVRLHSGVTLDRLATHVYCLCQLP